MRHSGRRGVKPFSKTRISPVERFVVFLLPDERKMQLKRRAKLSSKQIQTRAGKLPYAHAPRTMRLARAQCAAHRENVKGIWWGGKTVFFSELPFSNLRVSQANAKRSANGDPRMKLEKTFFHVKKKLYSRFSFAGGRDSSGRNYHQDKQNYVNVSRATSTSENLASCIYDVDSIFVGKQSRHATLTLSDTNYNTSS